MDKLSKGFRRKNRPGLRTRLIVPNLSVREEVLRSRKDHPNYGCSTNKIKTTKYTIWTFLPKNLFEQFHRLANVYFVLVVLLNWIPEVHAFAKEISMMPVIFVLGVSAVKDAWEDFRRYQSDRKINRMACKVYSTTQGCYVQTEWQHIQVGDFVHLSCVEVIPADLLLLNSSDASGFCHIETSNLDGETNLKQRECVSGIYHKNNAFHPTKFTYSVEYDCPNAEIYRFHGNILLQNDEKLPLNKNNILLRGCMLQNTDFVEGLVIYAGHETKAMLNNRGPRYKRSKLERKINHDIIWCMCLLFFLCLFSAVGSALWLGSYDHPRDVPFVQFKSNIQYNPIYQGFIVFVTYTIIFQAVIPLPLYVSVEIVKLGHVYFIDRDLELYYEPTNKAFECRAFNIAEDLGQVEYIFSDKTGTLTENQMNFKCCSIGGVDYPHSQGEVTTPDEEQQSDVDSLYSLSTCSRTGSAASDFKTESNLQHHLSVMSLASLSNVNLTVSHDIHRSHDFFLLMAVCNTVVVMNHPPGLSGDTGFVLSNSIGIQRPPKADQQHCILPDNMASSSSSFTHILDSTPGTAASVSITTDSITNSSSFPDPVQIQFEAESPDELALVRAAEKYGCKLLRRSANMVKVKLPGEGDVEFSILHILPFDSNRKRMSVILRHPVSGEITLYTKGADDRIICNLDSKFEEDDAYKLLLQNTLNHLHSYAVRGLRTLCLAKKIISEEVYKDWSKLHLLAENSTEDRERLLYESACSIESDLELLGATGIEDRLQDGVSETIENLREAGIKLWVLTGDKQETAVQVAYASKLFSSNQQLITINGKDCESTSERMQFHLEQLERDQSFAEPRQRSDVALVIDGKTLGYALEQKYKELFLKLTSKCNSVVCCRAAPMQKSPFSLKMAALAGNIVGPETDYPAVRRQWMDKLACDFPQQTKKRKMRLASEIFAEWLQKFDCKGDVVRLIRNDLKKLTLAIGDGANDVNMIQTADIGVGISGQEGMQAVMASDFAMARFRFLQRLLLVHGHWCYDRFSRFASFMLYKSLVSTFILFWYQIFSGFSGSLMIGSYFLMLEHVIFTALPPILNGILDKDLSAKTLLLHPYLYKQGPRGEMYSSWTFSFMLMDSLYQSIAIYFISQAAYMDENVGIWEFGTTMFVVTILVILLHLGIETHSWTWIQWLVLVLSFLFFWMFGIILNAFCLTCEDPANPYWVMENTIATPVHVLTVVLVTVVALFPRFLFRTLQSAFWPSDVNFIKRKMQGVDELKKNTVLPANGWKIPTDSVQSLTEQQHTQSSDIS